MAIRGHVDGVEGRYVVGWAFAAPDSGNCVITLVTDTGETIAKGRASHHRADLAVLGLGRTTMAFRVPVPKFDSSFKSLHVLADGQELSSSPLQLGVGRFDGNVYMDGDVMTGWVTERASPAAPPLITAINQHGVEVGRVMARFETGAAALRFNQARFSFPLHEHCFGAGEQILRVFANGVAFASTSCILTLAGNLESIRPDSCSGWLLSPEAPGRNLSIEIYRDGELAATAPCEYLRPDVRDQYANAGTAGFGVPLRNNAGSVTQVSTISLRLPGSDQELFNGPYVVGERPAAVNAAYRAARLMHMNVPGMGAAERAVLDVALQDYLVKARGGDIFVATHQPVALPSVVPKPRLAIIVPIYRNVEISAACIESVLRHRNPLTDQLILINDASPEVGMAPMLRRLAGHPNVVLLTNPQNLGFVQTANRGVSAALGADVLLLNADTVVHAGGFDELLRVAYEHPEVGTVTAISNNATLFSYPSAALRCAALPDISWPELAAVALRENVGLAVDTPTGHGFCMFIKAELLRRVGKLDEGFGRGYGEENDLCARAAALGYRNVAAGGVLVEHKENISFADEKAGLMARNLPRLNQLYPEYTPIIMEFERRDGLRVTRWALDRVRLRRARAAGTRFVLVVSNTLEGGTAKAIRDIEGAVGYGDAVKLSLQVIEDGVLELAAEEPLLQARFTKDEVGALLQMLDEAAPAHVFAHQILGFPGNFIEALIPWLAGRHSVFWAHDFYAVCPRVTMIDAIGRFCNMADADTCARCVEIGGAHEASGLTSLPITAHRALFTRLLAAFTHVVAPSANAAGYLGRAFSGLQVQVVPHPESSKGAAAAPRGGDDKEIVLLGAIGPHKGSDKLLEIASRARLTHPHLQFRVIGYTNMDKALKAVGNVTITGKYTPEELEGHLAASTGRLALFLQNWPETYSYTLSELAKHGFVPIVPDIGAPAERVRATGFGVVCPFPVEAETVLNLLDGIAEGRIAPYKPAARPRRLLPSAGQGKVLHSLMALSAP